MTGLLSSPPPGEPVRWRGSHLLPFVPADKRKVKRLAAPASMPHTDGNGRRLSMIMSVGSMWMRVPVMPVLFCWLICMRLR